MRYIRRMFSLLLCLLMLCQPVLAAQSWDAEEKMHQTREGLSTLGGNSGELLAGKDDYPAGSSACDWSAMALALSGWVGDYEPYLKALEAYVETLYAQDGGLDRVKSTPYHRIALTVLALGGDPTAFGTDADGHTIDLIADGTYGFDGNIGAQGLNGWIYALLTLDASGVEVPADAAHTRQEMIDAITAAQEEDGGFGLAAGASDVDITAMALQALAPYSDQYGQVVERALIYLSGQMTDDGTFRAYGDDSAESSAQVLLALCALGIDPETDPRFCRGVETVLTGIDRFRCSDGTYAHLREEDKGDFLATAQMLLAITALHKMRSGNGWIFDFSGYSGPDQVEKRNWIPVAAVVAAAAVICIVMNRKRREHGKKNG